MVWICESAYIREDRVRFLCWNDQSCCGVVNGLEENKACCKRITLDTVAVICVREDKPPKVNDSGSEGIFERLEVGKNVFIESGN